MVVGLDELYTYALLLVTLTAIVKLQCLHTFINSYLIQREVCIVY